jgi:hypothetical protein
MGCVDPDTEMVLRHPIFSIPGEPAAVDPMPGIGMDPDVDGGVGSAGHREFGHGGAGEIFGEVGYDEVVAMIDHDGGHFTMKNQEAAVPLNAEVLDVFEEEADRFELGRAFGFGAGIADEVGFFYSAVRVEIISAVGDNEYGVCLFPARAYCPLKGGGGVFMAVGERAETGDKDGRGRLGWGLGSVLERGLGSLCQKGFGWWREQEKG